MGQMPRSIERISSF